MNSCDDQQIETPNLKAMLDRLRKATENQTSQRWRLKLWSRFIRARDAHRCVYCALDGVSDHAQQGLAAHHIFRRCVLPIAEFDTGNGITLCPRCHGFIHREFNRRPLPGEKLNERAGDDQDVIASLYHALEKDALRRELLVDEFYFINDAVLSTFKQMQGIDEKIELSGARVSQAHLIWQMPAVPYYQALASGFAYELLNSWSRNR